MDAPAQLKNALLGRYEIDREIGRGGMAANGSSIGALGRSS